VDGTGAHEQHAPDWQTHEKNVTTDLEAQYGANNVAEQVTIRIKGIDANGNPFDVKIRPDNLIELPNGKYRIVDAKWSSVHDLLDPSFTIEDTFTINQQKAYDAIGNGRVTSSEVRGKNGANSPLQLENGKQIILDQGIDIAVDSPSGQGTRKYP
jgi:hypothetical protein